VQPEKSFRRARRRLSVGGLGARRLAYRWAEPTLRTRLRSATKCVKTRMRRTVAQAKKEDLVSCSCRDTRIPCPKPARFRRECGAGFGYGLSSLISMSLKRTSIGSFQTWICRAMIPSFSNFGSSRSIIWVPFRSMVT
jgi:hypothetical protein